MRDTDTCSYLVQVLLVLDLDLVYIKVAVWALLILWSCLAQYQIILSVLAKPKGKASPRTSLSQSETI